MFPISNGILRILNDDTILSCFIPITCISFSYHTYIIVAILGPYVSLGMAAKAYVCWLSLLSLLYILKNRLLVYTYIKYIDPKLSNIF